MFSPGLKQREELKVISQLSPIKNDYKIISAGSRDRFSNQLNYAYPISNLDLLHINYNKMNDKVRENRYHLILTDPN